MKEIRAIIQPFMLEKVLQALVELEALPRQKTRTSETVGAGMDGISPSAVSTE